MGSLVNDTNSSGRSNSDTKQHEAKKNAVQVKDEGYLYMNHSITFVDEEMCAHTNKTAPTSPQVMVTFTHTIGKLDYIFGFTMFRKSVKLKVVIH
jgi:hypothetical protein